MRSGVLQQTANNLPELGAAFEATLEIPKAVENSYIMQRILVGVLGSSSQLIIYAILDKYLCPSGSLFSLC